MSVRVGAPALAALLLACAAEQRASSSRVDHAGDPIDLDAPATRIVSLSPSVTELLFAIGAGDRVVGRTRWGTQPPAAAAVPSIGDGLNPSIEAILARAPDVVVLYHTPANAATIDRLRTVGVPTLSVRMDRLEDVPVAARLLADVLGGLPQGEIFAQRFEIRLDSLRRRPPRAGTAPSVVVLAWDTPPVVIGGGSFLSQLLELAGARNAFGELEAPSASVSLESIARRDPDLLLFIGGGDPVVRDRPEWRAVGAVARGHVLSVNGDTYSWPSFRSLDLVGALADALGAEPR